MIMPKEGYKANKIWGTFQISAAAIATKSQRSRHLSRIDYILCNEALSIYTKALALFMDTLIVIIVSRWTNLWPLPYINSIHN